jgi:GT2 family glycosyltransferase
VIGVAVIAYHHLKDLQGFMEGFKLSSSSSVSSLVISLVESNYSEVEQVERMAYNYQKNVPVAIRYHDANIGYARACNDAALVLGASSGTRTYAFFNADTVLRPGVLESCDDLLWSDPSYGVVGPRQVNDKGQLTHSGIVGPPPRFRSWKDPDRGQYTDIIEAWSVVGSAYFVKEQVWCELRDCPTYHEIDPGSQGAFLQTPHFFEDEWVSRHAVSHGFKVIYNGEVTLVHNQGSATPGQDWALKRMNESREIYKNACRVHGIQPN